MKAFNGLGIVIATILVFILLIPHPKDNSAPGLSDLQHILYFVVPLPVLMVLAYKRIILDPSERRIRITKGIWPIIVRVEMAFDDSAEIQLDAMQMRWIAYSALLSLPGQKEPILLLADGDEDQLRTILDFARNARVQLQAKDGIRKLAPGWIQATMPELNRSK